MASQLDIDETAGAILGKKRSRASISDETYNLAKISREDECMNFAEPTIAVENGIIDIADVAPPPLPPPDDLLKELASGDKDIEYYPCNNSETRCHGTDTSKNEGRTRALQMDANDENGHDSTIHSATSGSPCREIPGGDEANSSDNIAREAQAFRTYLKSKHANANADLPTMTYTKSTASSHFLSPNANEDHSDLANAFKKRLFTNPTPTLEDAYNRRDAAAMKRKIIRERKKEVLSKAQQLRDEILHLREKFRKKKEDLQNINSMLNQSSKEVGGWNKIVFDLELKENCAWNQKLQLLRDYIQENGGPPPPNSKQKILTSEERKINTFIKEIKKKIQQNHPSIHKYPHRKRAIEELGITLAISEEEKEKHFEYMLKKLIAYKREHGTYRMPKYDIVKSSRNNDLLLLHNWIFTEVTKSMPAHTKRFREIGFSFDNWCGSTAVQSTTQVFDTNTTTNHPNNSQEETAFSTRSSKHNGVRDMIRLAIINFLSTRHKNGRIQHGAIKEAAKKFGYSDSGIKTMWEKHKVGILDPSKGIDVRNRHGAGRKCKYDVDQIRRILITLPPAKRRTINEIGKACGVRGKSTMHRLLHSDHELLMLARNAGLTMKSRRAVRGDNVDLREFYEDRKRKDPLARLSDENDSGDKSSLLDDDSRSDSSD